MDEKITIWVKNGKVVDVGFEGLSDTATYTIEYLDDDDDDDAEPTNYTVNQNSTSDKPMSYMQQFETELRDKVAEMVHPGEVDEQKLAVFIKFIKEKHLASYRNGVEAGRTGQDGKNTKRVAGKFKK